MAISQQDAPLAIVQHAAACEPTDMVPLSVSGREVDLEVVLEAWHEAFEKMHSGEIVKAVLKP